MSAFHILTFSMNMGIGNIEEIAGTLKSISAQKDLVMKQLLCAFSTTRVFVDLEAVGRDCFSFLFSF